MMKRKHKIVVEITLKEPCNAKEAVLFAKNALKFSEKYSNQWKYFVTKWTCKSFTRVLSAEITKRVIKAQRLGWQIPSL